MSELFTVEAGPEQDPVWRPWRVRAILWFTVCITLGSLIVLHHGIGIADSTMFRVGATLCGPHLYRYDLQRQLLGKHDTPFLRAPFYAFMLQPLLRFDFARALFLLNLAAAAAVILLMPRSLGRYRYGLSPLVVLFVPLALNFSVEQDGALVLLVLSLSLAAEGSGFPFLAGAVLALSLEKPSLFLLIPLVLVVQKKFRMLWGYLICGGVLAILSLQIVGVSGIKDYIGLVSQYKVAPERMPSARGIAACFHALPLWPVLTILAAAATLWSARRTSFKAAFCVGIVGSLFISPQSYAHDLAILLLPVFYFLFNGSTLQKIVSALWLVPLVPLAYMLPPPWSVSAALSVLLLLAVLTLDPARPRGCATAATPSAPN